MPGNLSKQEVEKVARLSMLQLSEREQGEFVGQLDTVLSFIAQLQLVDTKEVPPTSHAMEVVHVLRDDVVTTSLSCEEATEFSSVTQEGYFVVPAVMAGRKGGR